VAIHRIRVLCAAHACLDQYSQHVVVHFSSVYRSSCNLACSSSISGLLHWQSGLQLQQSRHTALAIWLQLQLSIWPAAVADADFDCAYPVDALPHRPSLPTMHQSQARHLLSPCLLNLSVGTADTTCLPTST
jgi:hypothetical protein